MEYTSLEFKVIHWLIEPSIANHADTKVDTTLQPTFEAYPTDTKNKFRFRIRWTYRIAAKNAEPMFSYIVEKDFGIIYKNAPENTNLVRLMLEESFDDFRLEFDRRKKGTLMQEVKMGIRFPFKDEVAQNIVQSLKEQSEK